MTPMFDFDHFPEIETERLRLRQMDEADAPAILAHFGHPQVTRFIDLGEDEVVDLASAAAIIQWENAQFDKRQGWRWGITRKDEDAVIGTCGFHRWARADRRAEIGYDLHPDHWGQGYMTEIVARMVRFGFTDMNLHRIEADVTDGNGASVRVLEKNGFTHEGSWRERVFQKGHFITLLQFGLLESEYQSYEAGWVTT